MRHIIPITFALILSIACAAINTTPQQSVDFRQYGGRWYEQARYENWFERGMDNVYTDYISRKDGSITVINHGTDEQGDEEQARGRAFIAAPGQLDVSFVWPYWWFRAPYRILYVDSDYESALVSGESGEYLWLLTRSPQPAQGIMNRLLREARMRGFDTDRLRYTWHQKRKSTAPDTNNPG